MKPRPCPRVRRRIAQFTLCLAAGALTACALTAIAAEAMPKSGAAAALRAQYSNLRAQLAHSPLGPGLYLQSIESQRALRGDIYALVDYPFATVRDAFSSPEHWCETLLLHLNVKYCRAEIRGERTVLTVAIGRKFDQPLSDAYWAEFAYDVPRLESDYMKVDLDAKRGPLGTHDYEIALELTGLDAARSLLHVQYSYTYGLTASIAMRAYLATSGHDKVGFTMVGGENGGPPHYIGGVRGALERNIMRYYLAIDAYLGALATAAPRPFEESLERWFTATERYARQLHEVDRDAYVAMKRREHLRQQTPQQSTDHEGR